MMLETLVRVLAVLFVGHACYFDPFVATGVLVAMWLRRQCDHG